MTACVQARGVVRFPRAVGMRGMSTGYNVPRVWSMCGVEGVGTEWWKARAGPAVRRRAARERSLGEDTFVCPLDRGAQATWLGSDRATLGGPEVANMGRRVEGCQHRTPGRRLPISPAGSKGANRGCGREKPRSGALARRLPTARRVRNRSTGRQPKVANGGVARRGELGNLRESDRRRRRAGDFRSQISDLRFEISKAGAERATGALVRWRAATPAAFLVGRRRAAYRMPARPARPPGPRRAACVKTTVEP